MTEPLHAIDSEVVETALDRLLKSPVFVQAKRQQRLLKYIVAESVAGRGGRITQFSIGVDVFDRGADFDPTTDSAVRVEVGRLRAKLREYYESNPEEHVIFRLPKGRYVADISFNEQVRAQPVPARFSSGGNAIRLIILPFENLSDDKEDDYFADGITDDLITDMSKLSGLKVIARKSAFTYRGRNPSIEQLVEELGVTHVLEGSTRRAANKVRINAQLTDCAQGQNLWADRFDRELDDIFELQDEVGRRIITALSVTLTASDQYQFAERGTDNLEAYDLVMRATRLNWSPSEIHDAVGLLERARELDPNYAVAISKIAMHRWYMRYCGWNYAINGGDIVKLAEQAVRLDQNDASVQSIYGFVNFWWGSTDTCDNAGNQALTIDPTNVPALERRAICLAHLGRTDEASDLLVRAKAVNPHEPYFYPRAVVAYREDRLDEGIGLLVQSAERFPAFLPTHVTLATLHVMTDCPELAAKQIDIIRTLSPDATFEKLWNGWGNFGEIVGEHYRSAFEVAWQV